MRKLLIAASISLGMSAFVHQAVAQTLISHLPNLPITRGVPASAFLGQFLFPTGGASLTAPGCYYHLDVQTDGNIVTYAGSGRASPIWASNTANANWACPSGADCFYSVMQADGNFVLYDATNSEPWWATGTNGNSNDYLVQQEDGNLVIYNSSNRAIWASNEALGNRTGTCPASDVWTVVNNFGNTGSQFNTFNLGTNPIGSGYAACGIICNLTAGCNAFNFNPGSGNCGLIANSGSLVSHSNFQSGFRN